MKKINRSLIATLGILVLIYSCGEHKAKPYSEVTNSGEKLPNVIIILVDDAGYVDFGFMGSEDLYTPECDKLARSGVIFTDAHVSATVCAPSRAGIMTGQYQQRFGFEANNTGDRESGDLGLAEGVPTLAELFQTQGYATAAIGKWHLGATAPDHPNQRGFDDFYGFLGGGRSYFPLDNPGPSQMLQHNGQRVTFEGYLTDAFGTYSERYVEQHRNKPFFMYLAYNAVHTPMEAKAEHLEKFRDHPRKTLAAMTWSLDENVGKLRKKLDDLGILDNTLIIFLSDNGGAANNSSSNGVLKGWKGNKFEGGHRVPFVLSWPGVLKGGRTFEGLTSSLDIFPTVLAGAGLSTETASELDGVSLLPFLKGQTTGEPHEMLFWRKLEEAAVRRGPDKLIRLDGYGQVLYDLSTDLEESHNRSKADPETVEELSSELRQWEAELSNPLWQEEPEWMEVTYHIHKRLMENQEPLCIDPQGKIKLKME